jgi:hypothetical protein
MNVFISSIITGFEVFRDAAAEAIESLNCEVLRAEDFTASASSPQVTCLKGVRDADVVVLILGEKYGAKQQSGKSATHEEYDEAKRSTRQKAIVLFVHEGSNMEADQKSFLQEIERWQGGVLWKGFRDPGQLRKAVSQALNKHMLAQAAGSVNEQEVAARAEALLPERSRGSSCALMIAITGAPRQEILRPKQIEDKTFEKLIHKEAKFGDFAVLDDSAQTEVKFDDDLLRFEQRGASIVVDEVGSICIEIPARKDDNRGLAPLIEEDLIDVADRMLRFAGWYLDKIDSTERLTHVAVIAGLYEASMCAWLTRAEYQDDRGTTVGGFGDKRVIAPLRPPIRSRQQLRGDARVIAEDLIHLLKRARKL